MVGGAITPGEFIADTAPGIELNVGRSLIELMVTNSGDRAIQVGSHYHFIETNRALVFDRAQSLGFRLSVPSGASVRFEPGEVKTVTLVEIAGEKNVVSGNLLVSLSFAPPPPGRSCDGIGGDDRPNALASGHKFTAAMRRSGWKWSGSCAVRLCSAPADPHRGATFEPRCRSTAWPPQTGSTRSWTGSGRVGSATARRGMWCLAGPRSCRETGTSPRSGRPLVIGFGSVTPGCLPGSRPTTRSMATSASLAVARRSAKAWARWGCCADALQPSPGGPRDAC